MQDLLIRNNVILRRLGDFFGHCDTGAKLALVSQMIPHHKTGMLRD